MTPADRAAFIRSCAAGLRPPEGSKARERCEYAAQAVEREAIDLRRVRAAVDDSLHAVEGWGTHADRMALWAVLAVLDGKYDDARRWLKAARGETEEQGR